MHRFDMNSFPFTYSKTLPHPCLPSHISPNFTFLLFHILPHMKHPTYFTTCNLLLDKSPHTKVIHPHTSPAFLDRNIPTWQSHLSPHTHMHFLSSTYSNKRVTYIVIFHTHFSFILIQLSPTSSHISKSSTYIHTPTCIRSFSHTT